MGTGGSRVLHRDLCEGTGWTGGHKVLHSQPTLMNRDGVWGEGWLGF